MSKKKILKEVEREWICKGSNLGQWMEVQTFLSEAGGGAK